MKHIPDKQVCQRRSVRLKQYDYSQIGAYFVTVCTHNRSCLFGNIADGKMIMNVIGNIAAEEWIKTAEIRPDIELDEWVIMPNHIHGIIFINPSVGARRAVPEMCDPSEFQIAHHTQNINTRPMEQFGKPVSGSIPTIVRAFKSAVTKRTREEIKMPDKKLWQRNYYEHVIRTDEDLNRIREYIICNPMNWELSRDNPAFF